MATATAVQEWSGTAAIFSGFNAFADGGATITKVSMWALTSAPLEVNLRLVAEGADISATGNCILSYMWFQETGTASATAQTAGNNWTPAIVLDMNTTSAVQQIVTIPVEGNILMCQLENSSGGTLSAVSVAAIPINIKSV